MKSLKLFGLAVLCVAVSLVSCSGEDGEQGIQGEPGEPGADSTVPGPEGPAGDDGISCWDLNGNGSADITEDETNEDINLDGVVDALDCQGEQGQQGDAGQDGNANVQEYQFSLELFGNYNQLDLDLNTHVDEPNNYAYLFYMDTPGPGARRYAIPGHLVDNTHYARVFVYKDTGILRINFYDLNDASYAVPGGTYANVIVIAIELSNTGKTSENIMAELKAAGVDTSDYNQVAAYFGLE
ncbi:collagen-like triple helix repeat-containing protein [Flagellimonas sp.]|uniref:collagen-like triple helix repeat-containing protein n=1 Tax=Flagellimonas sp. TaxID=2058762 RepID=UPI003BAD5787